MNPQHQAYTDNQSFELPDQSDIEAHKLNVISINRNLAVKSTIILRNEFIADNWTNFKNHISYQFNVETELLRDYKNWLYFIIGLVIIYIHVAAHNLAYYMAEPGPPLHDLGHQLIPELSTNSLLFTMNSYLLIFMFAFVAFTGISILLVKYPGVKRFSIVGYLNRIFMVINITQLMRITTFLVTQVPAPNPNCRKPYFDPPKTFSEVFERSAGSGDRGCGDLIFSSHVMFGLTILLVHIKYLGLNKYEQLETTYNKLNSQTSQQFTDSQSLAFEAVSIDMSAKKRIVILVGKKQYYLRMAVIGFLVFCLVFDIILIIASRKHYSVDIIVSLYITYMVWHIMDKKYKDPKIIKDLPHKLT